MLPHSIYLHKYISFAACAGESKEREREEESENAHAKKGKIFHMLAMRYIFREIIHCSRLLAFIITHYHHDHRQCIVQLYMF